AWHALRQVALNMGELTDAPGSAGWHGVAMTNPDAEYRSRTARANGIDIHYLEAGAGEPLLVLTNSMISTHPIWADWHNSYAPFMSRFAEHFRVIAPDCRGSGKTVHPGGPIPHDLLADDVVALIDALDLKEPLICGYGDGGAVATIVGIRRP